MDSGPIYFFDQLKPERRKWNKETCEDKFTFLEKKFGQRERKSKEGTKTLRNPIALTRKDEFYSFSISEVPSDSKLPLCHKFSKMYWENDLIEEYKLTAPEILCELEKLLQKYTDRHITLPVGLSNLMNYTWEDLIEGASKYTAKTSMMPLEKAFQRNSSMLPMLDPRVNSHLREEFNKERHLVKAKKYDVASTLINRNQCSRISQDSNLPIVIHFSLSSKICLENGWIFHHPYSKMEILEWKTILSTAVKRLQVAIIQIKTEEAKLKKEGFNKQLILSHYNDPEGEEEIQSTQGPQSFWQELLERKPQMPIIREANPEMKKFHYALKDGSSLTYYPSGRLAVCQSYSDLPWGGVYTNIFSDMPNPVILGTFTPFGCGSISFPKRKIIAMMFNEDGGIVMSKCGKIVREWMWPSKGKLKDPVEIGVNKFMTVKISGRCAITLVYKWYPQSLTLSLAPPKCKSLPQYIPEALFPDINSISREARELLKIYKIKCKQVGMTVENKDPSSSEDPADPGSFDTVVDISPMHDIEMAIKLRNLQRKAKHILLHWLNYYRFAMGLELLHICKLHNFPLKVVRKQMISSANISLQQDAKKIEEDKEFLRYRNTFLKLKGAFKPSPLYRVRKTSATNQSFRLTLPTDIKNVWSASQLICPAVLRRTLCGKEWDTCRCSPYSIPEVTDLEYDHLISKQLSSVDQLIIVCVSSAKQKNKTIKEVSKVYRQLNRCRSMPCIQSRLDIFRFLKYNITSASKFTGGNCPLLVRRHNVIPGIFLMYIRGKLLFANFIFNGYSTSAEDLQKQILKTKNDYHMGYFLPSDYRIRA